MACGFEPSWTSPRAAQPRSSRSVSARGMMVFDPTDCSRWVMYYCQTTARTAASVMSSGRAASKEICHHMVGRPMTTNRVREQRGANDERVTSAMWRRGRQACGCLLRRPAPVVNVNDTAGSDVTEKSTCKVSLRTREKRLEVY